MEQGTTQDKTQGTAQGKTQGAAQQEAAQKPDAQPEIAYTTKQLTELIGVAQSTVRKYSMALEGEGYDILRNELDRRIFRDRDIVAIRQMVELTRQGAKVDNAARIVVEERRGKQLPAENKQVTAELLEYIHKQDKQIERMSEKLDRLLELQEDKTQESAASIDTEEKSQEEPREEPKKESWWKRLFNRKN